MKVIIEQNGVKTVYEPNECHILRGKTPGEVTCGFESFGPTNKIILILDMTKKEAIELLNK